MDDEGSGGGEDFAIGPSECPNESPDQNNATPCKQEKPRARMILMIIVVDKLNSNACRGKNQNIFMNTAENGLGK